MAIAVVPGWETFFEEIETFITSLQRQAGNASETFCQYAIERLEVCIVNLSRLLSLLRAPLKSAYACINTQTSYEDLNKFAYADISLHMHA